MREAQGIVLCTRCKFVFDSLSMYREHPYIGESRDPEDHERRLVDAGDRVYLAHQTAPAQPWWPPSTSTDELSDFEGPVSAESTSAFDVSIWQAAGPRVREWSDFLRAFFVTSIRNLLRYRRRTMLALSAIGFGVVALMLAGGFMEWIFWAMREATIQGRLGHIQVTRPGYLTEGISDPFDYLLPDDAEEIDILKRTPGVRLVTPRLSFTGLLSLGDNSVSFIAEGVDPLNEAELSVDFRIAAGEDLSAGDPDGIILGIGLAKSAGVKPGDSITLLSMTSSGGLNAASATIKGTFFTSNKVWNDSAMRVPLTLARSLLRVSGAHTWVVLLNETERTDDVLADLRSRFSDQPERYQFTAWHELADFYKKTVVLFSRQLNVVRLTVAFIIVLGISNVLIMSVLERTSEIGTLMAVGLKSRRILQLFVCEGSLLGVIGGLAGVGVGYAVGGAISAVGIPMPPAPGMDEGFTGEIMITWPIALGGLVLAISTTFIASLYPAWKASRLEIVNALRHSR